MFVFFSFRCVVAATAIATTSICIFPPSLPKNSHTHTIRSYANVKRLRPCMLLLCVSAASPVRPSRPGSCLQRSSHAIAITTQRNEQFKAFWFVICTRTDPQWAASVATTRRGRRCDRMRVSLELFVQTAKEKKIESWPGHFVSWLARARASTPPFTCGGGKKDLLCARTYVSECVLFRCAVPPRWCACQRQG